MLNKKMLKMTSVALVGMMTFGFAGMATTEASSRRPDPPRYEERHQAPPNSRELRNHDRRYAVASSKHAEHVEGRRHDERRDPPPPPPREKKSSNNSTNVAIAAVAGAVVGAVIAKNT